MNKTARLSALFLTLAASACASDLSGTSGIDFSDADDRLSDYDWQPAIREELQATATKLESTFAVTRQVDDSVVVEGPVYELDVPSKGVMEIELRAPYYMYLTDDLQFLLMTREDGGSWKPVSFLVEWDRDGIKTLSKISTFDHIAYHPEDSTIVAVSGVIGEFEVKAEELAKQKVFGVFALPEEIGLPGFLDDLPDNHRTIEGEHDFVLQASCNGIACDVGDFRPPQREPVPPEELPPGDDVTPDPEGPRDYFGAGKSIHLKNSDLGVER